MIKQTDVLRKGPDDARPIDDEIAAARAEAILQGLDLGDWDIVVGDATDALSEVFAAGVRRALPLAGFANGDETRNQARANMGLPPIAGGDTVPDIVSQVNERALAWAGERAADMVTQIHDNTRGMLRGTIVQALQEGWTTKRLADEIASSQGFSDYRSETIARTELVNAHRQGNLIGYRETGCWGKEWRTAGDDLVDDECQENEDEGPIAMDDEFPNGDMPHPNCRCDILPVIDEPDKDE